jgi:hypothetical protein
MIWALCDMEQERLRLMEARTALEVVEELMKMCAKKRALAATLMWCWWCERNSIREGHKARTCEELAWTITHQAEAFYDLNVQPKESLRKAKQCWQAPAAGWVKVNTDGSFFSQTAAVVGVLFCAILMVMRLLAPLVTCHTC